MSRSLQTVLAFPPVDPPTHATQVATVVLEDQTVDVWSFALVHKTSVLQQCQAWLSEQERARAQRLIHAAQGNDFILAHGALRGVLARYLALAPEAIRVSCRLDRQTDLAECVRFFTCAAIQPIAFSWPHAGCGGKGTKVGIDLEQVRETLDALKLGERFFAAAEYERSKNRTEPDRTWQFYRYWVAKEAVLKGQGIGIESLQQCEILPDGSVRSHLRRSGVWIHQPGRAGGRFNGSIAVLDGRGPCLPTGATGQFASWTERPLEIGYRVPPSTSCALMALKNSASIR